MAKKQGSLFDQFDTSKWASSNKSMEDFLGKTLVLFEVENAQGINGPARKLHFIDMDTETIEAVTTGSRFLLAMADQFANSDVMLLPFRVARVRQAFSADIDETADLDRARELLKD